MEVLLTRSPQGALIPLGDEEAEKMVKIKAGATVRAEIKQMRNARFFRKWWILAKFAYDIWSDTMPRILHKGREVQPAFERFRKDLTILAGYCHAVWNIQGEMRLEADSLSWAEMNEETFERLYSATIDTILAKVLDRPDLTPEKVRRYVDDVMRFS